MVNDHWHRTESDRGKPYRCLASPLSARCGLSRGEQPAPPVRTSIGHALYFVPTYVE
jgi:hypothetical protein